MTTVYDVVMPDGKVVFTTTEISKARAKLRQKKFRDASIESWNLEKSLK